MGVTVQRAAATPDATPGAVGDGRREADGHAPLLRSPSRPWPGWFRRPGHCLRRRDRHRPTAPPPADRRARHMDASLIVVVVVITALAFDFTNGFHDTANAMATSI